MFTSALTVFAALFASASATITINTPTNWQGNSTNVVTWTSLSTDPTIFSVELVSTQFNPSIGVANNIDTSLGSVGIPLPRLQPGSGFTLEFVNVSDINSVFATSGSFSIVEHDVNGNSTSAGSGSTVSAASTVSGIPGASLTTSGTVTTPVTGSTPTSASTTSSTGSSSGSSAVPTAFSGDAQKSAYFSNALFGVVLGLIVLAN